MKTFAIIGGVVIALGIVAYYFQPQIFGVGLELPEGRYTACQGERCISVDYYTISQGCLIESTEAGELKSQVVCGNFIVNQNYP